MSTTVDSPFPAIPDAPFWRAITPEAFGALVNAPPGPGDLDLRPGWELALISLTMDEGVRRTGWGWVRGSLSVHLLASNDSGVDVGVLSHLPSGRALARFFSDECAARAGELVAPLADWSGPMQPAPVGLRDRMIAVFRDAGFELAFVGSPDAGFEHVWASRPTLDH